MKILALETTEKFGSVALLDGDHILAERALPKDRRSSQTLHPILCTLFEETRTPPTKITVIAIVVGPGSFTGLRVGVTAAKVFAYATGAKIIAVDTFQTVAFGTGDTVPGSLGSPLVSVGVDAQRGEVVSAILRRTAAGLETIRKPILIPVADWWKHAEQYDNVLFSGPALERWSTQAPSHIALATETDWFPKASIAGKLAAKQSALGKFDDMGSLLPIYSRLSAAEENRNVRWDHRAEPQR